jgi:trehalose 6-phosphate phosphatase
LSIRRIGRRLLSLIVPSWADLQRNPAHAGLFLDFDGTLSTIVVDPAEARPVAGAVDALHAVGERYGSVAVVSGRPVRFLIEHLELAGRRLHAYGLYGLESAIGDDVVEHPEAAQWREVVAAAADAAEAVAPDGVGIERKGLSVTLHVRPAPENEAWARHFAEAEAAERGLGLYVARLSYELRPPVAVDKGTVVGELVQTLEAAAFIGDDRGDLFAFDALDRFAADGGTALKVAVTSPEAPPELIERADEILDGPLAVVAKLRELAN